jgi:hypothetical protein
MKCHIGCVIITQNPIYKVEVAVNIKQHENGPVREFATKVFLGFVLLSLFIPGANLLVSYFAERHYRNNQKELLCWRVVSRLCAVYTLFVVFMISMLEM